MIDHPLAIQVWLILPDSETTWDTTHSIYLFIFNKYLDFAYSTYFSRRYPRSKQRRVFIKIRG